MRPSLPGLIFFLISSGALFAAPPLRIAVSAGSDGLRTAEAWAALGDSYAEKTGEALEPLISADSGEALQALRTKTAEAAVLDTAVFLRNRKELRLLGIAEEFGSVRERFLLLVGENSIIHRPEDIRRARIVLAGPPGNLAWDYPLVWARPFGPFVAARNGPRAENGYEGVLKSIALDQADAGFLPEGFLASIRGTALLDRVRILAFTPAYPLAVLVVRKDLAPERVERAAALMSLGSGVLKFSGIDPDTYSALDELTEALDVDGP